MKSNHIEILGTTSAEEIKKYNIQYPYKEFCKSYTISLTNNKPKIGEILKILLKPKISEWKYIFTQEQYKIFVEGAINIRVMFLENPYDKYIYSTEINKIISGFLPIEEEDINNLKPALFVEEAFIAPLNQNKFSLSLLIAIGTISQLENKCTKTINTEESFEKEIDFEEGVDMERLKENSINVDVEYDMNWQENNF